MAGSVLEGSLAVGGMALLGYLLLKMVRKPARPAGNSGADGGSAGDSSWSWAGSDHCAPGDSGGSCDGGGDGGGGGD
jgi:hypothetical protein